MTKGQIFVSYLHQASLPVFNTRCKNYNNILSHFSRYTIIHIPSGCLTLPTTHSVAIMKYVLLSITASMFNVWKVPLSDFHRTINHQNQENEEAVTHVTVTLVT